jgi:hypothetical protein
MDDVAERIARKAYELWEAEGRPEGRHDLHWEQAREIIALEDAGGAPTIPLEKTIDDPVEPAIAFENQGEFPELTDQGDNRSGPEIAYATESADERPRTAGTRTRRTRRAEVGTEGQTSEPAPADAPKAAGRRGVAQPIGARTETAEAKRGGRSAKSAERAETPAQFASQPGKRNDNGAAGAKPRGASRNGDATTRH